MTAENLEKAVAMAETFLQSAKQVEIGTGRYDPKQNSMELGKEYKFIMVGKNSGACKRASMDLTRALAEMRKP